MRTIGPEKEESSFSLTELELINLLMMSLVNVVTNYYSDNLLQYIKVYF